MTSTDIRLCDQIPTQTFAEFDIFNRLNFFLLHRGDKNAVYLTFFSKEKPIAAVHFTETEQGIWRSPRRGTFGSFNFVEHLHLDEVNALIQLACDYLQTHFAAQSISIIAPPFVHNPHRESVLFNAFLNNGFAISNQELNYALNIDEKPLFEKMMRNNKKRYKKCEREGFTFTQVFDDADMESVYEVIHKNRTAKGYPMTMSWAQVLEMKAIFSENLFFFKTTQNNIITASSICIKINDDVLYVFYWGDLPEFAAYSPIVFLASGIYEFAQKNAYSLLDIGTSTVAGIPNIGLATFKENLGCIASLKLTYTKKNE